MKLKRLIHDVQQMMKNILFVEFSAFLFLIDLSFGQFHWIANLRRYRTFLYCQINYKKFLKCIKKRCFEVKTANCPNFSKAFSIIFVSYHVEMMMRVWVMWKWVKVSRAESSKLSEKKLFTFFLSWYLNLNGSEDKL